MMHHVCMYFSDWFLCGSDLKQCDTLGGTCVVSGDNIALCSCKTGFTGDGEVCQGNCQTFSFISLYFANKRCLPELGNILQ